MSDLFDVLQDFRDNPPPVATSKTHECRERAFRLPYILDVSALPAWNAMLSGRTRLSPSLRYVVGLIANPFDVMPEPAGEIPDNLVMLLCTHRSPLIVHTLEVSVSGQYALRRVAWNSVMGKDGPFHRAPDKRAYALGTNADLYGMLPKHFLLNSDDADRLYTRLS